MSYTGKTFTPAQLKVSAKEYDTLESGAKRERTRFATHIIEALDAEREAHAQSVAARDAAIDGMLAGLAILSPDATPAELREVHADAIAKAFPAVPAFRDNTELENAAIAWRSYSSRSGSSAAPAFSSLLMAAIDAKPFTDEKKLVELINAKVAHVRAIRDAYPGIAEQNLSETIKLGTDKDGSPTTIEVTYRGVGTSASTRNDAYIALDCEIPVLKDVKDYVKRGDVFRYVDNYASVAIVAPDGTVRVDANGDALQWDAGTSTSAAIKDVMSPRCGYAAGSNVNAALVLDYSRRVTISEEQYLSEIERLDAIEPATAENDVAAMLDD